MEAVELASISEHMCVNFFSRVRFPSKICKILKLIV